MKIVCRTVTGASTNYDVEPTDTIGSIKQRMGGEYDLASLRLCHKGKVLDDAKSIADLGFNDGEVLIIAGKKAKPAAAAPAPAPAPAPVETAAAAAQPAPAQPAAEPATPAPASAEAPAPASSTPATTEAPAAAPSAGADAPLPPGVDAATVEMIMGMGFPDKALVVRALQCAFGNAERAIEYVFSGIPPGIEQQFRQQEAQQRPPPPRATATPQGQQSSNAAAGGGGGGMSAEALGSMMAQMQQGQPQGSALRQALASIPQFEQIRALVSQNSAALPTVMQQLQQHHPEVFQLVQANPQEFLDIINEGPGAVGGAGGGGAGGEGEALPQLSAADQPAIERLVALGGGQWDARAAALVFMVSRRNEELAANILFDHGGVPPELLQALAEGGMGGEGGDSDDDGEA